MDKTVMEGTEWKTAITKVEPNKITIHGYAIDELMGSISYAEGVYLMIKGELPPPNFGEMMDTILVSSLDHGVTPPSVLAALTCTSTGGNLSQALASGILSINRFHGGAIENCQKMLITAMGMKNKNNLALEKAAEDIVKDSIERKLTLPGLGHRIHTNDPRTTKLFDIAKELGFYGDYCKMLVAIQDAMAKTKGKKLPINVDGAIAAILCEMKFPPELGNAFFMIARMPGLLAHIMEEQMRQKPMRQINPKEYQYDGREYRPVPVN
jgi:citrate synthase